MTIKIVRQPHSHERFGMDTSAFSAEQIADANDLLAAASPMEILRWAVKTFFPKLTMATAFGAEGCCLIHILADIQPEVAFSTSIPAISSRKRSICANGSRTATAWKSNTSARS